MLSLLDSAAKLSHTVYRGVDLPGKSLLNRRECGDEPTERDLAHDKQVHVAALAHDAAGCRPVDECEGDFRRERAQRRSQQIGHAERLGTDAREFAKHRALYVGLVVDLIAAHRSHKDAGSGEPRQFSLQRSHRHARHSRQLARIEPLIGVTQQRRHNLSAGRSEQRDSEWGRGLCTHYEINCTLLENGSQTEELKTSLKYLRAMDLVF